MNPRELPAKIAAAEKAGARALARHLRQAARLADVPDTPPEPRALLPALPGLSAGDLDGLGIPWTRLPGGGLAVIAKVRGGG